MQRILRLDKDDPNWLYAQSQRIAAALDRGEVALAQIYGLRIPVRDLDGRQLKQLGALAPLAKADFNPDEPRLPAGQPGGGEWTTGEDASAATEAAPEAALGYAEVPPAPPSSHLVGGKWPAPVGTNPLFHPAQAEEDENARGDGPFFGFLDLPREFRLNVYQGLFSRLKEIEPGNPALQTLTGPDYSPKWRDIDELRTALVDAQARAGELPSTKWQLGWSERGFQLELEHLGGERALPPNTPTIDDFSYDVALSIKSIDLRAPWYRDPTNLSRQINSYVDRLVNFDGIFWGDVRIEPNQTAGRVLDIIIPKNSGTRAQREAMSRSVERARRLGVYILFHPY